MPSRVLIDWIDSSSYSGWRKAEHRDVPRRCQALGFLIDETDEAVTLCLNRTTDNSHFGERVVIPKALISQRRVL